MWGKGKELPSVHRFHCPEKTILEKKNKLMDKAAMLVDKTAKKNRRTCTLCTNKDFSSRWREMLLFLSNSMPGGVGGGVLKISSDRDDDLMRAKNRTQ